MNTFLRRLRHTSLMAVLSFSSAAAIALLAGGAPAAADETFVVDSDAGTGFGGALFRVDPASGDRTLVSDFGNPAQGPRGATATGLAPEASGTVLVIDESAGTNSLGALFRVDPISGHRILVSDFGKTAQGDLGDDPRGLALEASGTILVIDQTAGTDGRGRCSGWTR